MKTQYYTASSLDGFIADENHSLDWLFQFTVEESSYPEFIRDVGAIAMGSHTYEWILRHLEESDAEGSDARQSDGGQSDEDPSDAEASESWPYEEPTWVFTSRSLPELPDADIRFVRGEVAPVHRRMVEAAGGKNVWVAGGGDLVGQFYDAGLLDELIIQVASVTLGSGAPLLPRRIADPPLRLRSARQLGESFVELRYDVTHPEKARRGPEGEDRPDPRRGAHHATDP